MKNHPLVRTAVLAFALPLALTNCSSKSDDPTSPSNNAAATGAFTWTESSAAKSGVVQAHTLVAGSTAGRYVLTLNASTAAGSSVTNNDQIILSLLNISGTGTYTLGINTSTGALASATFNRNRVGSPTAIWGAGPGFAGGAGSGSITISSFNASARTAAGSFSFVGGPVTNTNGVSTVTVTSGAFNVSIP